MQGSNRFTANLSGLILGLQNTSCICLKQHKIFIEEQTMVNDGCLIHSSRIFNIEAGLHLNHINRRTDEYEVYQRH